MALIPRPKCSKCKRDLYVSEYNRYYTFRYHWYCEVHPDIIRDFTANEEALMRLGGIMAWARPVQETDGPP